MISLISISLLVTVVLCSQTQCTQGVSAYSEDAQAYAKDIASKVLRAEAAERAASGQPFHTTAAASLNNYPIVMIAGLGGWARGELFGAIYWGGIYGDIIELLNAAGYTAFWIAGGKLSSTWDRACEDFAQIKGGIVDYGANHSAYYKHSRFQRNYTGVYPQWGTTDANGNIYKIHLIGHSEGAQDTRVLTGLLNNGWAGEQSYPHPASAPISLLFTGGHDWVSSVTTLAGVHDGSTFAAEVSTFKNFVRNFIGTLLALSGAVEPVFENIYDLQLDQWGLQRAATESISDYVQRVLSNSVFDPTTNTDICLWNLSPDGSKQVNIDFPPVPHVFYMSYTCLATWQLSPTSHAHPDLDMIPIFVPISISMGSYTRSTPGLVPIDYTWWPNDGIVSTRAEAGPTLGMSPDSNVVVTYSGTLYSGKFNVMGNLLGWDHLAVIGWGDKTTVLQLFENIASFLTGSVTVVSDPLTPVSTQASAPLLPSSNSSGSATPSQSSCQLDALSYSQLCGANAGSELVLGLTLTPAQCQALSLNIMYCQSHVTGAVQSSGAGSAVPRGVNLVAAVLITALIAAWSRTMMIITKI